MRIQLTNATIPVLLLVLMIGLPVAVAQLVDFNERSVVRETPVPLPTSGDDDEDSDDGGACASGQGLEALVGSFCCRVCASPNCSPVGISPSLSTEGTSLKSLSTQIRHTPDGDLEEACDSVITQMKEFTDEAGCTLGPGGSCSFGTGFPFVCSGSRDDMVTLIATLHATQMTITP